MNDDKLDKILEKVEPGRRSVLKKLVLGAGFAVPIIASFSVKDLANAAPGSLGPLTLTVVSTTTSFTTVSTATFTTTITAA